MADESKDQKLWVLDYPTRASWRIREMPPSTFFPNSTFLSYLSEAQKFKTEKTVKTKDHHLSLPSSLKSPQSPAKQVTKPRPANKVSDVFNFLRLFANNRKLKMTPHQFQNALTVTTWSCLPYQEGRRKLGRKERKQKDDEEEERWQYL